MSSTDDDDDRTLIRPPVPPAAGSTPADAPTPAAAAADDERTVFAPSPLLGTDQPPPRPPAASPDDNGNALPVGTRLGEFELTRVLGEGGFGIVYLAQDHSLHRRVALKEYMPSALAARKGGTQVSVKSERHRETFEAGLKSFVNEARLLAQFDHPSLVKVYRFWEANGTAYMVMPFYEGMTLKDKLREMGAAPDEAWLRGLLAPLTEALAVIHAEHCYHRDIAPDNIILLAGSGKPLLLDFGAARRVIGDMTQALTVILKPGYAPLEQYAEVPSMKQGPWTDVYALAAVVYFAIQGRTPPVSVGRMMGDSYQPLTEAARGLYSGTFLAAVDRALKVRPEDRTPSIEAFRADMGLGPGGAPDVQTVLQGEAPPPPAATGTPASAAGRAAAAGGATTAGGRSGRWIGIGAGVLVLGGVGAFFALTPGKPPPAPPVVATAPAPAPTPSPAPAPLPAPSPAPAPIPAPNLPFTVDGELDRIVQAQTPGFSVEASSARPQLRIGRDRLRYTVTSSRDGYVYTLVKGPDGSLVLLHPNTMARANRISAGKPLTLPPADAAIETSEPAGREDFVVIVSAVPRSFDHLRGKRDTFLFLPTGADAAALAAAHTGPGSTFAGRPGPCEGDACTAYGAVRFSVDVVR
ncbi:serine/threonine protein kinase [Aquincola tertiaricarbonis]|uniref:serine/threonine protein kinase n=1 Tax=Aquincola tertiaricarbonis TaxID=391953 RepID=UPI0009FB839E|nr:serine/threonine-protein kinase [Aquincola tertiaricarbonis]